jgi:ketosteroid isomerase-like protein
VVGVSQENVQVARRAHEALNGGDLETWMAETDPEVEWYVLPDDPNPGPYRGYEEILRMVAHWQEAFIDFRGEAREYIDAGEYVIIPTRMRGRPRESESEVVLDEVYVGKIHDGRLVEVREYRTREQALEALGLEQ